MDIVAPSYFATFGLSVRRGRGFTAADRAGAPGVVVLSASAARAHWPDGNAVGQRLRMGPGGTRAVTVVGVVPDTRYRVLGRGRAIGAAGAALGIGGALLVNRFLASLLDEVSPTDGATLAAVAAVRLVVGALASLGPARAGARVDPVQALRAA